MSRTKADEWITVKVSGRGTFPIDMLRHDGAVPHSSIDAVMIESSFTGDRSKIRDVFVDVIRRRFTPERWRSFGWVNAL